jgi:hypothetical protein
MENTQEMFTLSKYKFIRQLAKAAGKVIAKHLPKAKVTPVIPPMSSRNTVPIKPITNIAEQNGITVGT